MDCKFHNGKIHNYLQAHMYIQEHKFKISNADTDKTKRMSQHTIMKGDISRYSLYSCAYGVSGFSNIGKHINEYLKTLTSDSLCVSSYL
jgi:phosphoglycerate dehydrogenase-like enzyme